MANKKARIKSIHIGNLVQRIMIIIMFAWFLIFLIMPMIMMFGQIFSDNQGNWVGLKNFADYFSNPLMLSSIGHSLTVSIVTALASTVIGLLYAYGVTRTRMKLKKMYRYLALLPIFIPTMVHGMALIYLFGRTGLITTKLGIDIGLYGKTGIIMALIVYCLPQAYMIHKSHALKLIVKIAVTSLVLKSASAPARIISSRTYHINQLLLKSIPKASSYILPAPQARQMSSQQVPYLPCRSHRTTYRL